MTLHDFVNDPPEDEGEDTPSRMIDADVTAALDRWAAVPKDGGPEHQAASEALDDQLEALCQDREAWGQALVELTVARNAIVALADELERHSVAVPASLAELVREAREEQAEMAASAKRTREWLDREGFAIAAAARGPSHGEKRNG